MSHVQTVQDIYAAFGAGDIPAILDRLAPDVRWEETPGGNGAADAGVPWLLPRRGREEVADFFTSLSAMEFHAFDPTAFLTGGDQVAVVIELEATVVATGRRFADQEIHLWTLGDDGLVTEFRHVVDTAKHAAAFAGTPEVSAAS